MSQNYRQWKEIPLDLLSKWMNTLNLSKEGISLSIDCPIYNQNKLHRYYHKANDLQRIIDGKIFVGTGDLWEWCSSCYHFSRCYAAIPDWWDSKLEINSSDIHQTPEYLKIAIQVASKIS
jgi:hypothetical protein